MQLDLDRLGHAEPHRHLRDRHQSRPGRHQRQQPRAARPAAAAGRGAAARAWWCRSARPRSCRSSPCRRRTAATTRSTSATTRWSTCSTSCAALPGVGDAVAVRRLGLFDAHLAPARQARAVQPHAEPTSPPRCASRTQQFAAGRFGEEPMNKPQVFTYSVTTPGRAWSTARSSRTSSSASDENRRRAAAEGRGARRAGRARPTASPAPSTARRRCRSASTCSPAPTPSRWPATVKDADGAHLQALPRRPALRHPVRHHALRRGLDRGSDHHLHRGDRAGRAGGLPVPAERARDDHPGASPCRCRSSAPSPACTRSASRSTC